MVRPCHTSWGGVTGLDRWEWRDKLDTWNMRWQTPPARSNVAHLVTLMYVARQSIFVTTRGPARPKRLDLQIFVKKIKKNLLVAC
jgi:hypothetical protein